MNNEFPYPGLRPFERDETDIFFGREDHTDQLLEKLGQNRFLAVVGPSGCGKSSLVRTGLLAGLEGGLLSSAGIHWRIAEMRPGNHPFASLAEALLDEPALGDDYSRHFSDKAEAAASLQAALRRGPLSLDEIWQDMQLPAGTCLLLLTDQFEELFRYYQQGEAEETAAFAALLLAAYQNPDIYVIITMRSDFIGDCAAFYGLPEAVNEGLYLTPRLNREQLSEAMALPAGVYGGELEEGLLNRLLNDAGNDPDQLPIVQHALMRMWTVASSAKGGECVLTPAHYEQIGGFKKALSNHADAAYGELTSAQQKIAEVLFRNLSERDSSRRDTRRPTKLSEIARLAGADWREVVPVAETFRLEGRNFIVPPPGKVLEPDTVLDISHESLIRQWRRMQDWLNQEAESAELYQRTEETARRWKQGRAALLRSPELDHLSAWRTQAQPTKQWAERYGPDFELTMDFLSESEEEQYREAKTIQKRRRITIASLVGGLVIAVILSLFALLQMSEAEQQKNEAEKQKTAAVEAQEEAEESKKRAEKQTNEALKTQSLFLADLSRQQTDKGRTVEGMLLALEGLPENGNRPYVIEAEKKLYHAVLHYETKMSERFIMEGDSSIIHAAFSPDGKTIVTAEAEGAVRLWNAADGLLTHTLIGHEGGVNHAAFSPDGQTLATASDDTARLWRVDSSKLLHTLTEHEDGVTHAPTGERRAAHADGS
ncbi:MAG: hypothetical protein GY862_22560, partial [Gammaproteobacteria bacterium]|nr:hypothetical protein [Gammaproteobacteria bacterium]